MSEFSLTLLPVAKADREAVIQQVRDAILSGDQNPIAAEVALKGMEEVIGEIRKAIRFYVMNEVDKYTQPFTHSGAEIAVSDRRTYDFSGCGDSYYNDLSERLSALKSEIKEREQFLKSIPLEGVATVDGEIIRPPVYTTAEILTIKIK